jgi:hypothetical protein
MHDHIRPIEAEAFMVIVRASQSGCVASDRDVQAVVVGNP